MNSERALYKLNIYCVCALIVGRREYIRERGIGVRQGALAGLIAGAVGIVALNITTYADMTIRGRASSNVPAQLVGVLLDKAGISLSTQEGRAQDQVVRSREDGIGALLGYLNGLGIGLLYGLLQAKRGPVYTPMTGIVVGAAAMAASDIPIIALRVSDPGTWGVAGWISDAIPHLVYGIVTVITYKTMTALEED